MDTVMEMTPEELYSQKSLGPILASILGVSDKNVKVVNIGQSSTRRRRSTGSNAAMLTFEVGSMAAMGGLSARSMGLNDDIDIDALNNLQRKASHQTFLKAQKLTFYLRGWYSILIYVDFSNFFSFIISLGSP